MVSAQCKHIFFCAAGSLRYYATLDRHLAQTEKVTIFTGFVVDQNIRQLDLHTVSFAKVFKASYKRPACGWTLSLRLAASTSAVLPTQCSACP
jgi:hypothetical protein